ncbi:hypothetical protein JXQ31_15555 [candidate division KSB1 bacterium]|nr:hypothetical protein [candidate division KSB1 bacterium]
MIKNQSNNFDTTEERPPVLSSWNKLYAVVLFNLVFLIVIFYLFTKIFS